MLPNPVARKNDDESQFSASVVDGAAAEVGQDV